MTPQEIIREIHKLPPIQRKEIIDYVSVESSEERLVDEMEVAKRLLVKGIISEIPENWNEAVSPLPFHQLDALRSIQLKHNL